MKKKLVDDLYVRLTGELKSCREQLTSTRYQLEQAIQAHNQKLKDIEMNAKGIEVMKDLIGAFSPWFSKTSRSFIIWYAYYFLMIADTL